MRNNNREVIKMIAARQYQSNRGRNTILIAATALAVVMIFCIFSITSGKCGLSAVYAKLRYCRKHNS